MVIDRATGVRRTVRASLSGNVPYGVIAPDGDTAAMFSVEPDGTVTPYLLDLDTGTRQPIDVPIDQSISAGTMVWSPDSAWLFLAGRDGGIWAVDPATALITLLGVSLPAPSQLATRPTTAG